MKNPGRPPLDPTDRLSVRVCVRIPEKHYDELYKAAAGRRESVPELIRRSVNSCYPKSGKGNTAR